MKINLRLLKKDGILRSIVIDNCQKKSSAIINLLFQEDELLLSIIYFTTSKLDHKLSGIAYTSRRAYGSRKHTPFLVCINQ